MLVIEIALGIVLAVVILRYWKEILGLGFLGVTIIAVLASIAYGSYYAYQNFDIILPILIFITLLVLLVLAKHALKSLLAKLSVETIKRWDVSCGEILGITFSTLVIISGLLLIGSSLYSDENRIPLIFMGVIISVVGIAICKSYYSDIKREREYRAIRKTYED